MSKVVDMSNFDPLFDNLEKYVNKQGCTLGKDAERKARVSSDDFKKCQEITVTEIDMNEEQCVLTANTGA